MENIPLLDGHIRANVQLLLATSNCTTAQIYELVLKNLHTIYESVAKKTVKHSLAESDAEFALCAQVIVSSFKNAAVYAAEYINKKTDGDFADELKRIQEEAA